MILERVSVGPMEVNCYILASREAGPCPIIDPGAEAHKIKKVIDKHKFTPAFIVNTHGHYDHIGCDDDFGVPVYIHQEDKRLLQDAKQNLSALFALPYKVGSEIRILEEGQKIGLEDLQMLVLHIPGHTAGGIALQLLKPDGKIVFTGDSLFCQGIGRSDLTGGDEELLIGSIRKKLLTLPEDTVVYPGHGPSSTIGEEKGTIRFLPDP